jgi:hypothetical protein
MQIAIYSKLTKASKVGGGHEYLHTFLFSHYSTIIHILAMLSINYITYLYLTLLYPITSNVISNIYFPFLYYQDV